jgi:hypothetical protein
MSFRVLCIFAAFMFCLSAVNSPAEACDQGGAAGVPTFSFTAPQAYTQQFVAAPVVQQQVVTRQYVAAPVQQFAVQAYAAPVVAAPVVLQQRAPRRQVTRQVTTQRTGGLLFGR